jgi:hypothetical protein
MSSRERVTKHKYNVDGSKIGRFFSWLGEEGKAAVELYIAATTSRMVRYGGWQLGFGMVIVVGMLMV